MAYRISVGGGKWSGCPNYVVAEMSANHNQDFAQAVRILQEASKAGANAVKLQTYTPNTITLDCDSEDFVIKGTAWSGRRLYELYGARCLHCGTGSRSSSRSQTTWAWISFSTPFDSTAVDFLEHMAVPAYKVASFEVVDIPLLRRIARTGKPVILSTGMATLAEIEEAVTTLRGAGTTKFALLKCTSAYPASPSEMNLRTIPHLSEAFKVPVGLSDHTLDIAVPVAAVALGACVVEKHFTLSRSAGGPDSAFSLEPNEFRIMVDAIRTAESALGTVHYGVSEEEAKSRVFRRSLFVVADVPAGEPFRAHNVRSIRPAYGLHPRYLEQVLGRHAARDIARGHLFLGPRSNYIPEWGICRGGT